MKAEDGTGGKNSASQESEKDTRGSSSKLSSLLTMPKRNSRQKLARTRESSDQKHSCEKQNNYLTCLRAPKPAGENC